MVIYISSRCGKNAASVTGAQTSETGRLKKEKPNTCQSVGFVDCPLGGRKNGTNLTLKGELLLRSSRLTHVATELAESVGFDLADALG